MQGLSAELRARGLVHQLTDPELESRLDGTGLVAYSGFDPTADSLHVGHLLQVCNLRRLQLGGHRPIALVGGGTGFIGDPGGKSEERNLLAGDVLEANVAAIAAQLSRFLEFDDASGARLVNNVEWLAELSMFDFLRDVGKHFTVNQMVAKESVRARLERPEHGISYTEFSYMLLQAYDFLMLFDRTGCRLQIGGSDQWGNITMGIDLIRRVRQEEAWGLTSPLLLKSDGGKFGKTESGTVWLDPVRTSPYRLYQFLIQSDDAMVGTYLRYLTFLPLEEIAALDAATAEHPERRAAQHALAESVTTFVHGADETAKAVRASEALFGESVAELDGPTLLEVFSDVPSSVVARSRLAEGVAIVDLLAESGLVASKSQARTAVTQGGAYVNNRRAADVDQRVTVDDLLAGRYLVLRRGRKSFHLVSAE